MASLSLQANVSLYPNRSGLVSRSPNAPKLVSFPKKTTVVCSATDQPKQQEEEKRQQQSQSKQAKKKKPSDSDGEKGIDPVGFLAKNGVSHKQFAQFLRERYIKNEKKRGGLFWVIELIKLFGQ